MGPAEPDGAGHDRRRSSRGEGKQHSGQGGVVSMRCAHYVFSLAVAITTKLIGLVNIVRRRTTGQHTNAVGKRVDLHLGKCLNKPMEPEIVMCNYRVKAGEEAAFEAVLATHWSTLRDLELVTPMPPAFYLGVEQGIEGPLFVEIFEWVDRDAVERAHTHPAVSAIWERMGQLCEDRAGRPMLEFPHFRQLELR